jgi:hypothetical protein
MITLVLIYYWHWHTIQCEPCLPIVPCPPCETAYMAQFHTYFIVWSFTGFLFIAKRKLAKMKLGKSLK